MQPVIRDPAKLNRRHPARDIVGDGAAPKVIGVLRHRSSMRGNIDERDGRRGAIRRCRAFDLSLWDQWTQG